MLDRILAVLNYFQMSPSRFAEEIGVQRSGISHLISGRNKPSLEFIQKLLNRFPEINSDWILTGNGEMLNGEKTSSEVSTEPGLFPEQVTEKHEVAVKPEPVKQSARKKLPDAADNPVEKIVYFYRDKTFREYYPGQDA